jgi:hypothetical protein
MADDELRELLDERGARMLGERLRAAGFPIRLEGARLDLVPRRWPGSTVNRCDC